MKKFIRKLAPKTIASQLMTLLLVVLIFAQVINLLVLIGERRIQARANIFERAMNGSIQKIQALPEQLPRKLPYRIRTSHSTQRTLYFLSKQSIAANVHNVETLDEYEKLLSKMLEEKNIPHYSLNIVLNTSGIKPHRPEFEKPRPDRHRFKPPKHQKLDSNRTDNFMPEYGELHPPSKSRREEQEKSQRKIKKHTIQELIISVELKPNVWFNGIFTHRSIEALTPRILIATFILLSITLLTAWFFIRRISRPLSKLTLATEQFGRGNSSAPLDENGPEDIRLASQAFNTMQKRLNRMLETQRMMLRAVGHDLRTPLTSLRLRSELMSDESQREKFIETIDDMTLMTEEILNWAKNASGLEEVTSVDLNAFLASIVDDFADQGEEIKLSEFKPTILNFRRVAIKRAVINIINNALKYGQQAHVFVEKKHDYIDIHIEDKGLGIPEGQIAEALKPFVRLEKSRNKKTGGTGLGLSIAQTIIQTDGGKLMMENIQKQGFRVTICLPNK
jgi:signal transduction histidine kinase